MMRNGERRCKQNNGIQILVSCDFLNAPDMCGVCRQIGFQSGVAAFYAGSFIVKFLPTLCIPMRDAVSPSTPQYVIA
jgi:hypothetical protein